jgi:aminodeoxyfutalosine synthase
MVKDTLAALIEKAESNGQLLEIVQKVHSGKRIDKNEGLFLYENGSLSLLGSLANYIREHRHGNKTYFNRNFHIEPTNLCVFDCKFCSYSKLLREKQDTWFFTEEEILDIVKSYENKPVTEVHIVGGVHPKLTLDYFKNIIPKIKELRPDLHIKAFTAVEFEYMFRKAKLTIREGLEVLKANGLDSIPGGGAEIFDEDVRNKICADKCTSEQWLEIHETAHEIGIPSNATMLYGHIENYANRIDHMNRLRELQDRTGGFNTFIPLKFRNKDNQMSDIAESSTVEDLKCYAMSRIYLDNFDHIKAYWPMLGRTTAQLTLSFGVNDIDGTIDDTTKIYSMAGSEEQAPKMSTQQIVQLIEEVNRTPIERGTLYEVIKDYSNYNFEDSSEFEEAIH